MLRFFLPIERIVPRQFRLSGNHENGGKEDPYATMYDFEDSEDSDDADSKSDDYDDDCYTHTMTLEGHCWVLWDKTLPWPCNRSINYNL